MTGREARTLNARGPVFSLAFSRDGNRLISAVGEAMLLWDVATGREIRTFKGHSDVINSISFSPDGSYIASGSSDKTVVLWDVATGREVRRFAGHIGRVNSVAFSTDGHNIVSGSDDASINLWEATTGRKLRVFRGHDNPVQSVAYSNDGRYILSGSYNSLMMWEVASGRAVQAFHGHRGYVMSVIFSSDGSRAFSAGEDGTVRVWWTKTGQQLAQRLSTGDGDWLTLTPAGFFDRGGNGTPPLHLVRGLQIATIDQVYQSLFSPDLVREALAGDPSGEVQEAANVLHLDKVLDSGPAPVVAIKLPPGGKRSTSDLATVTAHIEDRGKGVGRIEWRVNGITAAVGIKPLGKGPVYAVTQQLALDPGDNFVEVVAYNGSNLLASPPARATINFTGVDRTKPKLHVLAIGINKYVDKGWTPPGMSDKLLFKPLNLAVNDARAVAEDLKEAAGSQYADVKVTLLSDEKASRDGVEHAVDKLATEVLPRDTFVFFAAAHGISESGRFYLIPQDYQGGPDALARNAIGQDRLQDWFANRIKAKKGLILLDTCESGALVAGHLRSRADAPASEAAIGRLHEATGRPVLTAAALGQEAWEGVIAQTGDRHGVFTWALLDALRRGDTNNDGSIDLTELVTHVQDRVSRAELKGLLGTTLSLAGQQSARFGSRGENFVLVNRLQ
jgi:uncharacterized caspase-like protein